MKTPTSVADHMRAIIAEGATAIRSVPLGDLYRELHARSGPVTLVPFTTPYATWPRPAPFGCHAGPAPCISFRTIRGVMVIDPNRIFLRNFWLDT
jgi:hypothetical protein